MTLLEAMFLGIVQGLTEFLPISSSGHLVLFQALLGLREPQLLFDVMVHFGTLLAVIFYFRSDLLALMIDMGSILSKKAKQGTGMRLLSLILLASLPAGVIGIFFKDWFETLFNQPRLAGGMLLITGTLLYLTRWAQIKEKGLLEMGWTEALLIGVAQGIAILPGISRSGATIATGLFLGLNREWAGKFSFLLSIPAIAGASILELREVGSFSELHAAFTGSAIAFLTGLLALTFLMKMIRHGSLHHFSYYCWGIGVALVILF